MFQWQMLRCCHQQCLLVAALCVMLLELAHVAHVCIHGDMRGLTDSLEATLQSTAKLGIAVGCALQKGYTRMQILHIVHVRYKCNVELHQLHMPS